MTLAYKVLNKFKLLQYCNVIANILTNKSNFKIPLINGLGSNNLNHKKNWLDSIFSILNHKNKSVTILDIGVNIGQTLLRIKSINKDWDYFGLEPNPNCIYYLNRLIEVNKFKKTTILPIAISDRIGILDLYFNHKTDASATTLKSFRPNRYKDGHKETVISFDLDSLILNYLKLDKVHVIKIDIEGSEFLALKGAKKLIERDCPVIICEVLDAHSNETMHAHKLRLKAVEYFLDEVNYNIYQIIRNEVDTKVLIYKKIDSFEIKIWNHESFKLNDYVFLPKGKLIEFKDIFNLIH